MARRKRGRTMAGSTGAGINLTPLLDIIFNLIFFFILATSIRDRSEILEITLPQAQAGEPETVDPRRPPVIQLAQDGSLRIDGEVIEQAALAERLAEVGRDRGVTTAVVASDANTPFQLVISVTEIVQGVGLSAMHRVETQR